MRAIDRFRENLEALIPKFEKDKNRYLSKGCPSAQVRVDFLNPFFKVLALNIINSVRHYL